MIYIKTYFNKWIIIKTNIYRIQKLFSFRYIVTIVTPTYTISRENSTLTSKQKIRWKLWWVLDFDSCQISLWKRCGNSNCYWQSGKFSFTSPVNFNLGLFLLLYFTLHSFKFHPIEMIAKGLLNQILMRSFYFNSFFLTDLLKCLVLIHILY